MSISLIVLGSFDIATRQLEYLVDNMASNQENSSEKKILQLQSSDGDIFDVEFAIAKRSGFIKGIIEDFGEDNMDESIYLQNIRSDILKKVIEFATHYKDTPIEEEDKSKKRQMTEWDEAFLKVDLATALELATAAHFLEMDDLLDCASQAGARLIVEKTPDVM